MAIDLAYRTGNNISITNSETSLCVNDGSTTLQTLTDDGLYCLFLDGVATMVKADEYLWKVYETVQASSTKRVILQGRLRGVQTEPFILPSLPLGVGWDMTMQRISANSRAWFWSVRRVS